MKNAEIKNAGTILLGMKEICKYTGYGRTFVEYAVKNDKFPAAKIQGGWQSNSILVDEWQLRIVRERAEAVKDVIGVDG